MSRGRRITTEDAEGRKVGGLVNLPIRDVASYTAVHDKQK